MSRFFLSRHAAEDLEAIRRYFVPIPERYGAPIRRGLRAMIYEIAAHPQRGTLHSQASALLEQDVRTRVVPPYRIFYRVEQNTPEILGILHTAQDVATILTGRLS